MILKIDPIFVKKPWGGNNIKKMFENNANINLEHGKIGEAILFSGEGENVNRIIGTNKFLDEFYKENKDKFFNNYYKDKFPFTIKLVDAAKNLPIIVYAKSSLFSFSKGKNEKNEIWLPLKLNPKEKFVVGVKDKDKNNIKEALKFYNWRFAFEERNLEENKAYNVKPGTVHGIKNNSFIYTISDNSGKKITIYDEKLTSEELLTIDNSYSKAILKALEEKNMIKPFEEKKVFSNENILIKELGKNDNFTLEKWTIKNKVKLKLDKNKKNFLMVSCIKGRGLIGKTSIVVNENVIITSDELDRLILNGNMTLLVANPNDTK